MEVHFKEDAAPYITEKPDGTKVYRTCAAGLGCHNQGCGLRVFVKDGVITKVEGDPDQEITKGRLCVRCLTALEYLNHEDRLLYPLKRAGKRGENKWERISWDEALDTIVEKYQAAVEEYGVNSVAVFCGTGREASKYHHPLSFDVFGTQTIIHPNSGWSCIVPRKAMMRWACGCPYVEIDNAAGLKGLYDNPKWECPKYMLIWGRDPLRSNADGLWGHSLIEMMKRGCKLIVADPRVNWLATRAEVHLQLKPGTDAALALGLLNVVISENLYDHEFVEEWTFGFDELAERVKEYPPEKVAAICDVEADDIIRAARCLSERPSTLSMGLAVDQNPNCLQIAHALLSLFAICGNMDVPGGCFMGATSTFGGQAENKPEEEADAELEGLAKYDNVGTPMIGHDRYPAMSALVMTAHPDAALDAIETGIPNKIRFAYIFNNNPLACMVTQPKRWYEALRSIDFVVVADMFMTPTIVGCADIVLPASTFFEHQGMVSNNNFSQPGQLGATSKIIEPMGECKGDLEIIMELHHRLYPNSVNEKYRSPEDYFNAELARVPGLDITYAELQDRVFGQYELEYKKYEKGLIRPDGQPGFHTPTGRIELYSTMLERFGDDPLPYYSEPKFSAESRPDLAADYPLTMTTGARRFTSFHSENRQIKSLREIHPWPVVQVNPDTAREYGITDGSWTWVENQFGRVKMMAEVTPIVKEGVISCDHGWWYPEADPEDLYDVWEANVSNLIPHEENGPLGFGTHYKCMPAKIYLA